METDLRRWMRLVEENAEPFLSEATPSPFTKWKRWWESPTGKLLSVPSGGQHDDYLMDHLDEFFDGETLDGDVHKLRSAAYADGWYTLLYDSSAHDLMICGLDNRQFIRKIATKIADEYPVSALYMDVMTNGQLSHHEVSDQSLEVFLKTGRLKPRGESGRRFA